MGMAVGGAGSQKADINVTPLVDVLLVLLIIFMVITPLTPQGLNAIVPQPPKDKKQQPDPTDRTIVVQVLYVAGGKSQLKINQDDETWDHLQARLTDIYKTRAEKIMFIKGDDKLFYEDVARVIDIARGADPDIKIGLITAKVEAGN